MHYVRRCIQLRLALYLSLPLSPTPTPSPPTPNPTKVGNIPGITNDQAADQIMKLNREAAKGGAGTAAVKMARAYLKLLSSSLPYDEKEAMRYFELAIQSNFPDGHFGKAQLLLSSLFKAETKMTEKESKKNLAQIIQLLEAAASMGHAFSMINLGTLTLALTLILILILILILTLILTLTLTLTLP